jgi:disulfide bond formation protein DsbB
MLNLQDFSRLLMIPIGAISGLGAAHESKAKTLTIVIFALIGLLLGFGVAWMSSQFERRYLVGGNHPLVYRFIPFVWIVAAWLAPALLALMIFGHR